MKIFEFKNVCAYGSGYVPEGKGPAGYMLFPGDNKVEDKDAEKLLACPDIKALIDEDLLKVWESKDRADFLAKQANAKRAARAPIIPGVRPMEA